MTPKNAIDSIHHQFNAFSTYQNLNVKQNKLGPVAQSWNTNPMVAAGVATIPK
jgi:hypothetical protein